MNVFFDIETIPDQTPGAKEAFIKDSIENFKAPSGLTKTQALIEMGIDPKSSEGKFMAADVAKSEWEKMFAPIRAEAVGVENWRKTGLDGAQGEIFSLAWACGSEKVQGLHRVLGDCEREFLAEAFECMAASLGNLKPFFVGNYIGGFDLKFLFKRAVILGVKPPFPLPHYGRHEQHYYDLQQAWEGYNGRASLDSICKAIGIPGKPDDIDGSKVWDFVEAGNYQKVMDYNILDVEETRDVYNRFTFNVAA